MVKLFKIVIKCTKDIMTNTAIPSTFLKNVLQNGVGRHVCQLQRITLSLCKSHPSSLAARDFVEEDLLDFTKQNPGIVFYIKPRRHRTPMLTAEYLNGYKEEVTLKKCSKDEITQWIGLMKGRSGTQIVRLRKEWHTDTPSIQGVWHPFLFKDTKVNVTDVKDKSLSEYISPYKSASDRLIELQNRDNSEQNKDNAE